MPRAAISVASRRAASLAGRSVRWIVSVQPCPRAMDASAARCSAIRAHRDALAEIARAQGWTLTLHRTDRPASEAALRLVTLVAAARGAG